MNLTKEVRPCRACKAPIFFAPSPAGKMIPIDAAPEKRIVIRDGVAHVESTFTAHFATCPEAEQFRRRRNP